MWGAVTPRVLRATAAALVGLAAGGTFVLAHGGDPSRVHACVSTADGRVTITVDPADNCSAAAQLPVDWNIRTAEGAPGADGLLGATGPQGPAGRAGHDGSDSRLPRRAVAAASPWAAPGSQTVDARCRADEFAVSGAWRVEDPSRIGEFRALENRPLADGRGWRVQVEGRYAYRQWRLVVEASCTPRGEAR